MPRARHLRPRAQVNMETMGGGVDEVAVSRMGPGERAAMRQAHGGVPRMVWMATAALLALLPTGSFAQGQPQVRLATRVLVEVDVETPLIVQVGPAEAIPANSYIQLRGLPEHATLNEGHSVSAGIWAVPLRSLPMLSVTAPQAASGSSEFTVRLVDLDGRILSEAKSTMTVAASYMLGQRDAGGRQASTPSASIALSPSVAPPPPPSQLSPAVAAPTLTAPPPPAAALRPAPVPVPPPAAPPPVAQDRLPPEERQRLERMVSLGNRHLGSGNIAAAREFFRRAADGGLAEGALLLATTYDPAELEAIKVQGLSPDPAEARRWYERAKSLGAAGVDARLARLAGR